MKLHPTDDPAFEDALNELLQGAAEEGHRWVLKRNATGHLIWDHIGFRGPNCLYPTGKWHKDGDIFDFVCPPRNGKHLRLLVLLSSTDDTHDEPMWSNKNGTQFLPDTVLKAGLSEEDYIKVRDGGDRITWPLDEEQAKLDQLPYET